MRNDLLNLCGKDDPNRYIDDKRLMIKECDGDMRIVSSTTSRYGYIAEPIYGVYYKYKTPGYPEHAYQIFVGECPYKNEDGTWVTEHNVPNFVIPSFYGAHYIEKEPDIPHIIQLSTDEDEEHTREQQDEINKKHNDEIRELSAQVTFCTLPTYLKGIWNRIKYQTGEISKTTADGYWSISYIRKCTWYWKLYRFVRDGKHEWVFMNDDNVYELLLKKDNKKCFKYSKYKNPHCGSSI